MLYRDNHIQCIFFLNFYFQNMLKQYLTFIRHLHKKNSYSVIHACMFFNYMWMKYRIIFFGESIVNTIIFSFVSILVTHFRPWRQSRARHHHPGLGDNRHLNHHRNRLHRVVQEQQCGTRRRDNDYRGQTGSDHFRVTPGPKERPRDTQNNVQTAPAGQGCDH